MSSEYPNSRFFFNLVGGCLTLLSLQVPWVVVNGLFPVSLQSDGILLVPFFWILSGAILSFISRYGGVMTFVGMLAFLGEPYLSYGAVTAGQGSLLALTGAILSFAGVKWSIPRPLIRGREIIGGTLYSVGFLIVLTLTIGLFFYGGPLSGGVGQIIVEVPLWLVGIFATGLGLRMFLSPGRRAGSLELLNKA